MLNAEEKEKKPFREKAPTPTPPNPTTPPAPEEPTFFPKLQVYFADFPCPHLFIRLEIVHLEDLLR